MSTYEYYIFKHRAGFGSSIIEADEFTYTGRIRYKKWSDGTKVALEILRHTDTFIYGMLWWRKETKVYEPEWVDESFFRCREIPEEVIEECA